MAVDDEWITIGQAAARLGLHQNMVRALADSGRLRSWRPPATGPGHSHRRVSGADVEHLRREMSGQTGPDQENV